MSLPWAKLLYSTYHTEYVYTTWLNAAIYYEGYHLTPGHGGYSMDQGGKGVSTLLAWGFVLCDYDHLFDGAADNGGASSTYRVAEVVTDLHNGEDLYNVFVSAYDGHSAIRDWVAGDTFFLQEYSGDLNAYLYYLMWGHWFGT